MHILLCFGIIMKDIFQGRMNSMKPSIFFLMSSIGLVRGGITQATYKQASLFAKLGFKTYILTFDFNPEYPLIRKKLLKMGKVHKDVIIKNIYEDLEGISNKAFNEPVKQVNIADLANGLPYDMRKGYNAYRIYNNGIYQKYISLYKNGALDFIDYFNEGRYRTKRIKYDPWGHIKRVEYMDYQLNKPRQAIFYNNDGQAYLTKWMNPKNGEIQRTILFNQDSVKKVYIKNEVSFKVDWISKNIKSESVVVADTRSSDKLLINLDHPKVAKVWRLHSNHLTNPDKLDSNIAEKVIDGFENIDQFDVAVFLTEQQKSDVIKRIGEKTNYKVVPHYHETNSTGNVFAKMLSNKKKECDEKLAVIVSRLSTLKRVNHSVQAFAKVVKEVPDARLEIWGTGTQEEELKKLIKKLGLQNNVSLKGFTYDSNSVFNRGLFSLFTSKSEGFGLSCLESMSNETPVISYNIKYGPIEMITNNENGFIIENGNIEELAEKMLYMFNNPDKARDMGKRAAKQINSNYNQKIYKDKWLEVIDTAMENKFQR